MDGETNIRNGINGIGMNVKKAYTYLADVVEHKQVVPFRRFNGSIGRASQAKAFKETKGGFICDLDGFMEDYGAGENAETRKITNIRRVQRRRQGPRC
jgi:ribosomal protein L22